MLSSLWKVWSQASRKGSSAGIERGCSHRTRNSPFRVSRSRGRPFALCIKALRVDRSCWFTVLALENVAPTLKDPFDYALDAEPTVEQERFVVGFRRDWPQHNVSVRD